MLDPGNDVLLFVVFGDRLVVIVTGLVDPCCSEGCWVETDMSCQTMSI